MNKQTRKRGADPSFPRLLGEQLCLDFVNTVEGRLGAQPGEFLTAYADLARWGRHVGIMTEIEVEQLLEEAGRRPVEAVTTYEGALALRQILYNLFLALARGAAPAQIDLDTLQQAYLAALARTRLAPGDQGYHWRWIEGSSRLDHILWPVVQSAVDLLTSGELDRVKECRGVEDCGWLFFDTSKNRSRQWCSMEGCGSRVKMRRLYDRQRKDLTPSR
jgi:predicted RNA-binding Zn ribbon-like protein